MRPLAALWMSACCGAFLLAGCGGKTPQSDSQAADSSSPKPRIALIMKSLANEFFQTMENGAREHQKQHAGEYDLIANGIKDELDVNHQTQLVEQMAAQKVSAIVIAPAESKALLPSCKQAADAGIVVVNIDNKFDDNVMKELGVKMPFVGPDNRKGARLAGEYLAKRLKPGDAVAIIEGVPTAFNAVQRKAGFEDAMKAGGMKIVASQSASWDTNPANQLTAALITGHPDLKGILCANDKMALGAAAALRAAGKSKDVLVVGFDNISAVQELIRQGQILATVDQHADRLAVFGIEYALEMLKNKGLPADRETPVDLITSESLK